VTLPMPAKIFVSLCSIAFLPLRLDFVFAFIAHSRLQKQAEAKADGS
jgi:hypothetical protein